MTAGRLAAVALVTLVVAPAAVDRYGRLLRYVVRARDGLDVPGATSTERREGEARAAADKRPHCLRPRIVAAPRALPNPAAAGPHAISA
jgi:hypothetical protein